MSETLSVFNAERTIIDNVFHHILDDIQEVYGINPDYEENTRSIKAQREAFLGWIAHKDITSLDPVLDLTYERTSERLAPWAIEVLEKETANDNKIILYSATVPQPILDALADGVEDTVNDSYIERVVGKPLKMERGKFTGHTGSMLKAETLEKFQDEGFKIDLVVDSFKNSMPAIKKGRRKIIVNPDRELSKLKKLFPTIFWHISDPMNIKTFVPGDAYARFYDLSDDEDKFEFLDEMYSN